MKNYGCPHCGSIDVFMKAKGSQTGLYCGDCSKWIKWVSKSESELVERFIAENKNKRIIIQEGIGVKELRQLYDLQSLNNALNEDEFMEIVGIYKKVIDRLAIVAEKQGIKI